MSINRSYDNIWDWKWKKEDPCLHGSRLFTWPSCVLPKAKVVIYLLLIYGFELFEDKRLEIIKA